MEPEAALDFFSVTLMNRVENSVIIHFYLSLNFFFQKGDTAFLNALNCNYQLDHNNLEQRKKMINLWGQTLHM